ncbi:putative nucleoside-diphosphate sugar epimerase [Mycobacterium sp. JS623]|uniref:SDR family oxidoreductase n=1 Tax=Mycobacterium sp. JS623 TaxID=212767 RepID=UPI0002A56D35|nr:SDR family oxidoreductase [Mycobacterium sp. JS623]AGB22237.1 putative nucleoside-diphosphate sugar epimerase [Mycobacterium sp. JS623]
MILVTTAGKVGSEASRLLAARGDEVRILARHPETAAALAAVGVDVVRGDLETPATIDAAMNGVSSVVLVSPAIPAQERNVIDSAVRAGVAHVVKITSEASADSPIARRRGQAAIEARLIASGLGYTLLRNNAYMQNFLVLAPAIAATGAFASCAGDGRVGMVDTRDVGAVAAEIAASPALHAGKTYWPTGPETLSYADAAATLSTVLGRPITFRPQTIDEERQAMISAGLPESVAEDNARALALFADGDADYLTGDVAALLGRPARTFEQFATDYAEAFSPSPAQVRLAMAADRQRRVRQRHNRFRRFERSR